MPSKSVNVKLGADITQFQGAMKKAQRTFKKSAANLKKIGKSMTMSLTAPLTAFAGASVMAFDKQAKAEAKLRTALKGNEKAFKTLTAEATKFQNISTFGDEEIIAQQAYLASLGMTEEQINSVIAASMDLASGTGQTLDFGVKNLAKTFGGLTGELGESIPALKNLTKEQLMAGAAVDVVAQQFKGQAEAAAEAGTGGLKQLQNRFGDLMEGVGKMLIPVMNTLLDAIDFVIDAWTNLDGGMKIVIITIGGIVAAIGPAVALFGSLLSVIGFLISPMGAVVIALSAIAAAIIYVVDNFEAFKERFTDLSWWINIFIKMRIKFNEFAKFLFDGYNKVLEFLGMEPATNPFEVALIGLNALQNNTKEYKKEFGSFGDAVSNAATKAKDALFGIGTAIGVGGDVAVSGGESGGSDEGGSEEGGGVLGGLSAMQQKLIGLAEASTQFGVAMAQDFAGGMAQAVVAGKGLLKTMGQIFIDLAKKIAALIIQALILAAVFAMIPGLGAAFGGPTDFLGILTKSIPGRASGGPVIGGRPYIVGENGPELFSSNVSGQITPNHALGGGRLFGNFTLSGSDMILAIDNQISQETDGKGLDLVTASVASKY